MRQHTFAFFLAGLLSVASAQQWRLGAGFSDGPVFSVGVQDAPLLDGTASASFSTQGGGLHYVRALSLPPLGVLSAEFGAQMRWQGGYRLAPQLSGVVGPVALQVQGQLFNDLPLAKWQEKAQDERATGWNLGGRLSYRALRASLLHVGGQVGGIGNMYLDYERRYDFEQEGEPVGNLSSTIGAVWEGEVKALRAQINYATSAGQSFGISGLLGLPVDEKLPFGVRASASFDDLFDSESDLNIYAAYEPWRELNGQLHQTVRIGARSTVALPQGTLALEGSGGTGGLRFGLSYAWPLGQQKTP